MIAVGGGGADGFSSLVSNPNNIDAFVTSVLSFLDQYKFDGLDIDWEFPSSAEMNGYSNLMIKLRQAFGSKYLLSMAASAIPPYQDAGEYQFI